MGFSLITDVILITILKGSGGTGNAFNVPSPALPCLTSFPVVLWKLLSLRRYRKGSSVDVGQRAGGVRSGTWPRMGILRHRSKR